MTPTVRWIAIIGGMSLCGALGGLALGNFTVSGREAAGAPGADSSLAAVVAPAKAQTRDLDFDTGFDTGSANADNGPEHYECVGCDARLSRFGENGNEISPFEDPQYFPDPPEPSAASMPPLPPVPALPVRPAPRMTQARPPASAMPPPPPPGRPRMIQPLPAAPRMTAPPAMRPDGTRRLPVEPVPQH